jgi:hypothetical protein
MTNVPEKAYLELHDAGHSVTNSPNPTVSSHSVAWLKRFVDLGTRYTGFICPGPTGSRTDAVSAYLTTCPV